MKFLWRSSIALLACAAVGCGGTSVSGPLPAPAIGSLTASWAGTAPFTASGAAVTTNAGSSVSGGVIAFAAVGQVATITLAQSGATSFVTQLGTLSGAAYSGSCTGNVTIAAPTATTVTVTDTGTAFNGCLLTIAGAGATSISYQITGPVSLSGSAS
jgi:hypothetical protein